MKRIVVAVGILMCAVCAIGTGYCQPNPSSPWPMFRHDERNTGMVTYTTGPANPALAWSYAIGNFLSSSVRGGDGSVYVGSNDAHFYAMSSQGALLWSYDAVTGIWSSPSMGNGGGIYFGCQGSSAPTLFALNSSGSLRWSYWGGGIVSSSPVLGSDGRVFIGSTDNNLCVFNSNGSLAWTYSTGEDIYSSPALDNSRTTVYFGSYDNRIYCVGQDGALRWSYLSGGGVRSAPSVMSDGRVVASSKGDGYLYILNPNGSLGWSYYGYFVSDTSSALGSGGRVIIGGPGGVGIYAFNSNGSMGWTFGIPGASVESQPSLGSDGTVYVGCDNNALYSVASDGSFRWSYLTANNVRSSPAVGGGSVCFSSDDNTLYCLGAFVPPTPPTATPAPTRTPTPTTMPTATPVPQAEVVLNGTTFSVGQPFQATFRLNRSVEQPFTAYAVVVMPDGFMLDALTLGPELVPVASNVPRLDAPFTYPLMNLNIPAGAPSGDYQMMAGFFTPGQPIQGPQDAFLLATSPFAIR